MRDRSEQILRGVCLVLAALVLADLVNTGFRARPLAGVVIPPVPVLATNAPAVSRPKLAPAVATSGKAPGTNAPANHPSGTNASITTSIATAVTNHPPVSSNVIVAAAGSVTNTLRPGHSGTNLVVTNSMVASMTAPGAGSGSVTNQTNSTGTNSAAAGQIKHKGKRRMPMGVPGGMDFAMLGGQPGSAPKLAPEVQARVDQIVNSEIFAPVDHPLPMGLLGIAGDTAFLRTDDGQTGLVKVGDSVGNLKLLRIGINRVLVEQDGQSKELTMFDGYGGDSLLTEQNKNSK